MLIDYDPALNWGNWNYSAGVGLTPEKIDIFLYLNKQKSLTQNLSLLDIVTKSKIYNDDILKDYYVKVHVIII